MKQRFRYLVNSPWGSVIFGLVILVLVGLVGGAVLVKVTQITTYALPLYLLVVVTGVLVINRMRNRD